MRIIHPDSGWQLFLDRAAVERETGLDRKLHVPEKKGPVLEPDRPWEWDLLFPRVFYDGGRFHCLYQVRWPEDISAYDPAFAKREDGKIDMISQFRKETAYAVSDDGIHWEKPPLGLVDAPLYDKRDFTNPVITGSTRDSNCGAPFDFCWDVGRLGNVADPEKRFLLRLRQRPGSLEEQLPSYFRKKDKGGLCFSPCFPDFVNDPHWKDKLIPVEGNLPPRGFDNFAGWDEQHGQWVSFMQGVRGRFIPSRDIARWHSPDLRTWGARSVIYPDSDDTHTLERFDEAMEITVVRCEGFWLGFLVVFHGNRTSPLYTNAKGICMGGTTEIQLAVSRDGGLTWERTARRQPWLPHSDREDAFDRCVYAVTPVPMGERDYFYHLMFDGDHAPYLNTPDGAPFYRNRSRLIRCGLAVQRRHGYVSMSAGATPRVLYTRPAVFTGGEALWVNADATRGRIQAEITHVTDDAIQDLETEPVADGRAFDDCDGALGDGVRQRICWRGNADLSALRGKTVRFRFRIQNADLYGFTIQ